MVSRLGGDLPVVVEEEGWEDTGEELDDVFIGDADIWRWVWWVGGGMRGGDIGFGWRAGSRGQGGAEKYSV